MSLRYPELHDARLSSNTRQDSLDSIASEAEL